MLIMIKLRKALLYTFARSRVRREIEFDPKLKDFTNQEQVRLQTDEMRKNFEKVPTEKFSTLLEDPNPKLGVRFQVDKQTLNKKISKTYKQNIKRQALEAHDEKDFSFLAASKSHIYDQKQEIEFEQKFKQQLFRTKETRRLIQKKSKNVNNYLEGKTKDEAYLKYEASKKELKNRKIENMMKMNRNNEQLQLLISSGLFNDPNNIKAVIDQISSKNNPQLLQHIKQPYQQQQRTPNEQKSYKESGQDDQQQLKKGGSSSLVAVEPQERTPSFAESLSSIGPVQLQHPAKVEQFISNYEQQQQQDRQACLQDLNLLKNIREYEQQVFLDRYDAINFRFKGRLQFGHFKEQELVEYIKTEKIEPKQLLQIFKQNEHKVSKFNLPIITPSVLANIYSKTALYRFPETAANNRVNMLAAKEFQGLQAASFKQMVNLNNNDFCSLVYSYASNHQDEQGALNHKLYTKINALVVEELGERIWRIEQADLGLVMRAISKLDIKSNWSKFSNIIECIGQRLPDVRDPYVLESTLQFLACCPRDTSVRSIVANNISKLNSYKWQQMNTLTCFINCAALLLSSPSPLDAQTISSILLNQQTALHEILPSLSINTMPQFITVVRECNAALSMSKTINLCQKLITDNIKTQKQMIHETTVGQLIGVFGLVDLEKYYRRRRSKLVLTKEDMEESEKAIRGDMLMRKQCIRYIIPHQPIPYNSSLYKVYHELSTLLHNQMHNIPMVQLAQNFNRLCLIRYKNQPLLLSITQHIIQQIQNPAPRFSLPQYNAIGSQTRALVHLINGYSMGRWADQLYFDALELLFANKDRYATLCQQTSIAELLKLITSITALGLKADQSQIRSKSKDILEKIIAPQLTAKTYIQQEISCIAYCAGMLDSSNTLKNLQEYLENIPLKQTSSKFIVSLSMLTYKLREHLKQEKQSSITQADYEKMKKNQDKLDGQFYLSINQEVLENQASIGAPLPYPTIYAKLSQMLPSPNNSKKWRIEVPSQQKVYFIASQDHLMAIHEGRTKSKAQLHGVWRLYRKYYELRGWECQLKLSFLEGR